MSDSEEITEVGRPMSRRICLTVLGALIGVSISFGVNSLVASDSARLSSWRYVYVALVGAAAGIALVNLAGPGRLRSIRASRSTGAIIGGFFGGFMSFFFTGLICLFGSSMIKLAGAFATIKFLFGGVFGWASATLAHPASNVNDQNPNEDRRQNGEMRS